MPYIGNVGTGFNVGTQNINNGAVTGEKLSQPFNYDSGTLYLDDTNNRVGILTASPTSTLTIGTGGVLSIPLGAAATPSLIFGTDTNTGVYSPGADQVAISTGGTGRLFVDASGRVGIGTGSITAGNKLQVNVDADGDYAIYGISPGASGLVGLNPDGTNGNILRYGGVGSNSGVLRFVQGVSTERMRLDSSGRLGLGTSEPNGLKLGFGPTTSQKNGIDYVNASPYSYTDIYGCGISGGWAGQIRFFTSNTGAAQQRVVIDEAGRLGLSNNAPDNLLTIGTSAANHGVALKQDTITVGRFAVTNPGVNNNPYIGSVANNDFYFITNNAERARIDSSGRLLVGTSTARELFFGGVSARLQVEGDSTPNSTISIVRNSNDADGPSLVLGRSRSTGNTIIQNGDRIGRITFQGNDGTSFLNSTLVESYVDGTPGIGDMPTRLVFSTTADGASSPTERLRITSTGQVRLAGAGITFNGDTAAANELDDYEEGTFTPTVAGSTTAGTATHALRNARYTKIGRLVHIELLLNWNSGTGTGNLTITGLPFTSAGSVTTPALSLTLIDNISSATNTYLTARVADSSTTIQLWASPVGGGAYGAVAYDGEGILGVAGCYSV